MLGFPSSCVSAVCSAWSRVPFEKVDALLGKQNFLESLVEKKEKKQCLDWVLWIKEVVEWRLTTFLTAFCLKTCCIYVYAITYYYCALDKCCVDF